MTQRETEGGDETVLGDTARVWKDARCLIQTLFVREDPGLSSRNRSKKSERIKTTTMEHKGGGEKQSHQLALPPTCSM